MQSSINIDELIYPLFVKRGKSLREEIPSMPGIYRFSPDTLLREAGQARKLGLKSVLLFGIPGRKDASGKQAYQKDNVVAEAVRKLKGNFPKLTVITDVCLCAYTTHGHCGVLKGQGARGKGQVNIDDEKTLEALAKIALGHAEAGTDYVAPSACAKKQVSYIRQALDKQGFRRTKIIGYSAKFASNFYGPFRDAANSAPSFGDRKGYQLAPDDAAGAMKRIEDDINEGADIVMVKPALSYLDIIKEASLRFRFSLAAYSVSGEYAMLKQGARLGLWDEKKAVFEIATAVKRAGADYLITYYAKDIAKWLKAK